MEAKSHVVLFDQGNKEKPFDVITESKFKANNQLALSLSYKYVYTDIFTGYQEQCEEFIDNHKLRRYLAFN